MTFGIFNKKLSCVTSICMALGFTAITFATPDLKSNFNPLETAINNALHLESSWNTVLRIDPRPERPISVLIPFRNQKFTLELETHSTRSEHYQVLMQDDEGSLYEVPAGPVRTMRGTILEIPGSIASGSLMEDGLYARIRLGNGEEVWMEPISDRINGSPEDLYAFYFTHDVMESDGICGTVDNGSHFNVDDILKMLANYETNVNQRGNIICTAQIAFDTDYEYYQDWGSQAESRINQVVNSINTQYEDEVSISFEITHIIVRSTSSDPYTTSNCSSLLQQFENEWISNHGGISRDVAHLFTGRNLADCVGIAYTPGVCQSWAYSLAQSDYGNNYSYTTQVSAHELGHGFNASHQETPYSNTMYPAINGGNTFNSNSVAEITSYSNQVNCLSCENQAPTGACCIGSQCVEIYESNCVGGGGDWQGDNTTCSSSSCIPPTGACCVNGSCYEYEEPTCVSAGGSYAGDNTDCGSVGCTVGACCVGIDCSITLQAECAGSWYGDNTNCADISCGAGADELNYVLSEWSRSDQQEMNTLDVFFPSTDPNTRMTAVFGQDADLLQIRAWSNNLFDGSASQVELHQNIYGGDFAHDRALDVLGIDLVYDSYVTIGTDDGADGTPNALGFDSAGFNNSSGMYMDNGVWFVTPDSPLASMGAGTGNGHRITSLSVEAGQGVELLVNVQWYDGANVVHETRNIYWNNDGIGDGGNDCATDINGNGTTDVTDLLEIIGAWGACSGCAADVDGNGQVNVSDLLEVIGAWGPCP